MILCHLPAFANVPSERRAIRQAVEDPTLPVTDKEVHGMLQTWRRLVSVIRSEVGLVLDFGVLTEIVIRAVQPVTDKDFERDHSDLRKELRIREIEASDASTFDRYIKQIFGLLRHQDLTQDVTIKAQFAGSGRTGGAVPDKDTKKDRKPITEAEIKKRATEVCSFFDRGACRFGTACHRKHDRELAKHGAMCYQCGARGPNYHHESKCTKVNIKNRVPVPSSWVEQAKRIKAQNAQARTAAEESPVCPTIKSDPQDFQSKALFRAAQE